jgi:hypothetical protein
MVREPEFYVAADSPHAHRSEVATEDSSWSAMKADIAARIAEIARFDQWVGLKLELEAGFGLRGKEARHLKPHGAIVTCDAANPRDAAAFPECRTFLHINAGELKIIAAILEQPVIEKILTHLGLQARAPPRAPARGEALQAA